MVAYNSILDVQFNDGEITEPVNLTDAKNFCKIDISTDDALITSLIVAARQMCEAYTGVGFVPHDVTAIVNNGNGDIYLPYQPMIEIVSVEDEEGVTLVADVDYKVRGNDFVRLAWPKYDNLTINYLAGYSVLPEVLRTALLNQIYYLYDQRSQSIYFVSDPRNQRFDQLGPIAKMLLNPFKRV
jgi:uncharacterized phiE125 gp8 family phage protein